MRFIVMLLCTPDTETSHRNQSMLIISDGRRAGEVIGAAGDRSLLDCLMN